MVGIVIVSHSNKVAQGVKELVSQMSVDGKIATAGGTNDGRLGTDVEKIIKAINEVYCEDGVLVLFDLGSAYMNAEMAIEGLDEKKKEKVEIIDTALVEGALTAAVEASIGKSKEEIKESLKTMCLGKMP
ncbi:PTS-dependent dihydroxyacetone kinase phosphotransferase subunit DhaM [Clostridiaceae bacterium UIB06]|uniref:PTS-dependent dihydroxyacetone kinase phosphotransferase subunit DhaM n=1 Tax=Clostridium thailandense TaxID=2794346 RepID=A0A949WVF5_9CLOT|nr:dihydroxyacetone kinase phosphoryl donor subunit DhaM [Clostridium thailandense]MBV7273622.1 PTS-dependent dihydroxyacetone kinase phosphotransferase subunit DhaM [Clostridium thailandense]MCH5136304.1 PTS-dependent dihydroxyacetone kinase phosphotransferase subunit DhaM [Clostridiaceae bacterium UIB06]